MRRCSRQVAPVEKVGLGHRLDSLKVNIMLGYHSNCSKLRHFAQGVVKFEKHGRLVLQGVHIDFDTLFCIGKLDHLAIVLVCCLDELAPTRKILSTVGVSTCNTLDEFRTTPVLLELEPLNLLAFCRTPEPNGIFWDGSLRVVEHQLATAIRFVDQVAASGTVVAFFFRHDDDDDDCMIVVVADDLTLARDSVLEVPGLQNFDVFFPLLSLSLSLVSWPLRCAIQQVAFFCCCRGNCGASKPVAILAHMPSNGRRPHALSRIDSQYF
mmetsp:Transcript_15419/g.22652  ORF Transcript_15419/g.22652 Transcript_15419/m.22652 type:complete len:267 (+) Transcript_15419:158-958(+)